MSERRMLGSCETCGWSMPSHQDWCAEAKIADQIADQVAAHARRTPHMHFMRGPIAYVLPGIIEAIPPAADVTITETRNATGKKALTITATWNEDQ